MANPLSLPDLLASLQTQIARHREQEAFHAEREAFHRELRAEHAAELDPLVKSFEALQASVANAAHLAARLSIAPPPPSDDLPVGRKISTNYLVGRAVQTKTPGEAFGPGEITAEINRRFAPRLGRKVDIRQVSVSLRWMADTGRISRVSPGHQRKQSRYARA
ncbi:MAG TPA: hypothetical protein VIE43_13230 [Thermoanaerobaculia bacterium]|jgi:hypothetical protein|nr:hypothetical protein [Thermoanaerobaculia bacterium]